MSRCFPYPPPHFDESSIRSIKIRNEKKKAEKEARSKVKDKKKEKKEKKRDKVNQIQVNSKHEEKGYEVNNSRSNEKVLSCQNTINDAADQFEGSGLTEEDHEMPCSVKNKHDSPESSQDSNKRRKVVPSSSHNAQGSVLRIKISASKQGAELSSQLPPILRQGGVSGLHLQPTSRQREDSTSHPQLLPTSRKERDLGSHFLPTSRQGEDSASLLPPAPRLEGDSGSHLLQNSRLGGNSISQVPSSKRKSPGPPEAKTAAQVVPPSAKLKQLAHHDQPAVDEQPCFSGRTKETASASQAITVPLTKKKSSSSKRVGGRRWQKEQFEDLVENWKPPSLQVESSDTAHDWLLATSKQRCTNKTCIVSTVDSGCGNYSIPSQQQPRACYIPELDLYQLPYVVPF